MEITSPLAILGSDSKFWSAVFFFSPRSPPQAERASLALVSVGGDRLRKRVNEGMIGCLRQDSTRLLPNYYLQVKAGLTRAFHLVPA